MYSMLPASIQPCLQRMDGWVLAGDDVAEITARHPPGVTDADTLHQALTYMSQCMDISRIPDPEKPLRDVTLLHADHTPARPTFTLICLRTISIMQELIVAHMTPEQMSTMINLHKVHFYPLPLPDKWESH